MLDTREFQNSVPAEWTCDPIDFNRSDGCHCRCGVQDPDCDDPSQILIGCVFQVVCNEGLCKLAEVPDEWTCAPQSFGTNDGCDCNCGAKDFDCAFAECETDDYNKAIFAFLIVPFLLVCVLCVRLMENRREVCRCVFPEKEDTAANYQFNETNSNRTEQQSTRQASQKRSNLASKFNVEDAELLESNEKAGEIPLATIATNL